MITDTGKAINADEPVRQTEELKTLEYCLQFARKTYEQETERQKSTANKADYLFKYLTLMTTAFSITVSVVSKMNNISVSGIIFWSLYLTMLTVGIIGLLSTLMIQRPRKIRQFPKGTEALAKVQQTILKLTCLMEKSYARYQSETAVPRPRTNYG